MLSNNFNTQSNKLFLNDDFIEKNLSFTFIKNNLEKSKLPIHSVKTNTINCLTRYDNSNNLVTL